MTCSSLYRFQAGGLEMSEAIHAYTKRLAIAAVSALSFTPCAKASIISYDFTVTITSGVLNGHVDKGRFSYDSRSIPPSDVNSATGLLTALNFTFNGVTYNAHTVNTGSLIFDSADELSNDLFGTNCGPGSCSVDPDAGDEWFVSGASFGYVSSRFKLGSGDVTYRRVSAGPEPPTWAITAIGSAVPEPSTWAMMLTGFAGLGLAGWRALRKSASIVARPAMCHKELSPPRSGSESL
jgi:hypothetical protein